MWHTLSLLLALVTIVHCTTTDQHTHSEEPKPQQLSSDLIAELILKNDCIANYVNLKQISVCLKTKLLVNLNELIKCNRTIDLNNYVHFVKTKPVDNDELDNRIDESDNEIPDEERSLADENAMLTKQILKKVVQFFQTRSVKFNLESNDEGGVDSEGRKKKDKDKGGMMMMMAMGIKGMMMQMMMGKVAMIAMKALVIGKIALILSAILALKKMMSSGGGGSSGHVVVGSEHGGGWSRSINEDFTTANDQAYSGYAGYTNPTWTPKK